MGVCKQPTGSIFWSGGGIPPTQILRLLCEYMKNVLLEHTTTGDCSLACSTGCSHNVLEWKIWKCTLKAECFIAPGLWIGVENKWFSSGSKPSLQVTMARNKRAKGDLCFTKGQWSMAGLFLQCHNFWIVCRFETLRVKCANLSLQRNAEI